MFFGDSSLIATLTFFQVAPILPCSSITECSMVCREHHLYPRRGEVLHFSLFLGICNYVCPDSAGRLQWGFGHTVYHPALSPLF